MKKFKTQLSVIIGLIVICVVLFATSCGNSNNGNNTTNEDTLTAEDQLEEMVYPLSTPFEISQMLIKAEAGFVLDVTNPTKNAEKYFTEKQKALNLGIYGADLSYTSTYNRSQETRDIMVCTKKLTDDLGISTYINQGLSERIEKNIENKDSLYKIVTESYYDTFNFLNRNGKGSIAVLVLAGGWIEGLYLSTQLAISSPKNQDIINGISTQKTTVNDLVALMEKYKENKDVAEVYTDVLKIKAIFDKVPTVKDAPQMTKPQFEELLKTIEGIRANVVKI